MRLRGIKRYPKVIKKVYPIKHNYGADVTWSAHTDTYKPNLTGHGIDAEINAEINTFKNNLQLTALITPSTDEVYKQEIKDVFETGRFDSGLYFRAFLDDYLEQNEWHKEVTGHYPSYWSYGNGRRMHDDFVLNEGLITRLSQGGKVSYDFDERLEHNVSSVFNYDVRDNGFDRALEYSKNILQQAIGESGWYNDFSHWPDVHRDKDLLEHFFGGQRELLNTVNSVTLGSGKAVEYMWLRKQFKRGGLYQDGNELVLISDVWNEDDLP